MASKLRKTFLTQAKKIKKMKAPRFVKDKWFYISIAVVIILIVIAFEIVFNRLDQFTRHGEEMVVPDLVGMNYVETQEKYGDIFHFQLVDSVYVRNFPEGAVYQQNPKSGLKMKKGRNMYIVRTTVSPEIVKMPNLKNLSLRQAMVKLNSVGLNVDNLVFVDYFARNAVIGQLIDGKEVAPNDDVVKGRSVTLKVGLGNGDKTTHLPDMVGTPYRNVKNLVNAASLNLGTEIFIDTDEYDSLFVYKMEPEYDIKSTVPLGSDVNVWYKSIRMFDFRWYDVEKHRRDSIVERLRRLKADAEDISYVIDSFNYILSHRTFSYDSVLHIRDLEMMYERPDSILDFDEEDLYFNDSVNDNIYFYDE